MLKIFSHIALLAFVLGSVSSLYSLDALLGYKVAVAKNKNKYALISNGGELLLDCQYDYISTFSGDIRMHFKNF